MGHGVKRQMSALMLVLGGEGWFDVGNSASASLVVHCSFVGLTMKWPRRHGQKDLHEHATY